MAEDASIDYFIGSVHHAGGGVPIDLDKTRYARARDNCAAAAGVAAAADVDAAEAALYASYYDDQHAMLAALRPRVVGHVDLVRLLSEQPGRDVRTWAAGNAAGVWVKVVRNLRCVRAYGGWLECNTSALRKGLAEPYPARAIAEEWIRLGGRFTFSDDSHGIAQVATHYSRGLDFLESLGVNEVMTLERRPHAGGRAELVEKSVSLVEFRASLRC